MVDEWGRTFALIYDVVEDYYLWWQRAMIFFVIIVNAYIIYTIIVCWYDPNAVD